ncbi:unnamed protein product [Durusdinium trenchii]|uniref:Pentatricopeptide repeat-containing protein, chloroplastic n=1 Tax=Durusdinium trenchii TaxID=1381693 RepID=A0ABP0LWH6_9DINO
MKRQGPQPTDFAFSAMMRGLGPEHWEDALLTLQEMPCQWDAVSVGATVASCVEAWEWATMIATQRRYDLRPNAITCSSLIHTYESASRWEAAMIVVERTLGNVVALAAALSTLEKQITRWKEALGLLNSHHRRRTQLNIVACSAAISACAAGKASSWHAAFWLFEGLRPSSLQPNLVTFGGCLTALQQMAQWERSLRTSDTFSRDVPAYGAQVAACAMSRRWVEVLWLLKDLKKHKLEKDAWMQQWTVYALGSDKGQACGGVEMLSAYQAEQMLRATQRTPRNKKGRRRTWHTL